MVTTVQSVPGRAMRALPIGTSYAPSGTTSVARAFFAIHGRPITPLWNM